MFMFGTLSGTVYGRPTIKPLGSPTMNVHADNWRNPMTSS